MAMYEGAAAGADDDDIVIGWRCRPKSRDDGRDRPHVR
jgi:hypothetical protein